MARSDHNKSRNYPGHRDRKKASSRLMRRLSKKALEDAPIRLGGFARPGFCCGYHKSDWRF